MILRGIDVSGWQGPAIEWSKVAGAGYAFAYVRASHGVTPDEYGAQNIRRARAIGLRVGAYHYLEAAHEVQPQIDTFLRSLPPDIEALPPMLSHALDIEEGTDGATDRALEWLSGVENETSKRPIVYTFPDFAYRAGFGKCIDLADYDLWIAHWGTSHPTIPAPWTRFAIWQSSKSLAVNGIRGKVDLNIAYDPLPGA